MKKVVIVVMAVVGLVCGGGRPLAEGPLAERPLAERPLAALEVTMTGSISHTNYLKVQSGKVTFNRFPASVEEFMEVREKIGREPHGAVALQIMAYEMYRRDRNMGTECIMLNNTANNVNSSIRRLSELFGNDAGYARPYQMAAFLKGATPQNGYRPSAPYTIEVKVSRVHTYQYSEIFQNKVLYLEVFTKGKDKGYEVVEVLKTYKPDEQSEGQYFIVLNCSGLYSQVKAVSFSTPFQGLE